MNYYEFRSRWIPINTPPGSGERCIVTDGEHVTLATYLVPGEPPAIWMFSEIEGSFEVIGWMPVPKAMKLPISSLNSTNNTD